jgi:hypothetical protein
VPNRVASLSKKNYRISSFFAEVIVWVAKFSEFEKYLAKHGEIQILYKALPTVKVKLP